MSALFWMGVGTLAGIICFTVALAANEWWEHYQYLGGRR